MSRTSELAVATEGTTEGPGTVLASLGTVAAGWRRLADLELAGRTMVTFMKGHMAEIGRAMPYIEYFRVHYSDMAAEFVQADDDGFVTHHCARTLFGVWQDELELLAAGPLGSALAVCQRSLPTRMSAVRPGRQPLAASWWGDVAAAVDAEAPQLPELDGNSLLMPEACVLRERPELFWTQFLLWSTQTWARQVVVLWQVLRETIALRRMIEDCLDAVVVERMVASTPHAYRTAADHVNSAYTEMGNVTRRERRHPRFDPARRDLRRHRSLAQRIRPGGSNLDDQGPDEDRDVPRSRRRRRRAARTPGAGETASLPLLAAHALDAGLPAGRCTRPASVRVRGALMPARRPRADSNRDAGVAPADTVSDVERLLWEREAQYRAIFEAAGDGLEVWDLETERLVEVNPAHCRMHGFTRDELLGDPTPQFIHPDDAPLFRSFLDTVRKGGEFRGRVRDLRKDGTIVPVEVVGKTFTFNGKPHVLGVLRDISEQERAQAELERSEKRFRALIEHSSDVITLTRPDGILSYASPSTTWVLGYDPAELVGGHALARVHADDCGIVGQALDEVQEAPRKCVVARYRTRHGDGSWRWVETTLTNLLDEPAVGAIVANQRDVSAEVEAQQALEQRVADRTRELATLLDVSRAMSTTLELEPLLDLLFDQLKAIIEYSAVGIHVPGEDGGYMMLAYAGPLPPKRMVGIPPAPGLAALMHESEVRAEPVIVEDFGGEWPSLSQLLAEGVSLPPEAFGHAHALLVAPLIVKGRNVGGLLLVHRAPGYYTERHAQLAMAFAQHAAAAVENARLYEAARGLAALEERQRLARELHDSVSQALYAVALNSAAAGESLQKRDTRRAARLVTDVRLLARAGLAEMRALIFELRPESLAEEGLVAALTKQAEAIEARHDLTVRLVAAPEPAVPLQTKEALYRIAQEGLHNIVKHAGAHSAEIAFELAGEELALSVRDDGRGFEVAEGLALPGHLGLRSMRERVERLGGRLEVNSRPGSGTLVRAVLPVACPARGR